MKKQWYTISVLDKKLFGDNGYSHHECGSELSKEEIIESAKRNYPPRFEAGQKYFKPSYKLTFHRI